MLVLTISMSIVCMLNSMRPKGGLSEFGKKKRHSSIESLCDVAVGIHAVVGVGRKLDVWQRDQCKGLG